MILLCLKPPKNWGSMFKFVLINFINYFDNNVLVKNKTYGSCKVTIILKKGLDTNTIYNYWGSF